LLFSLVRSKEAGLHHEVLTIRIKLAELLGGGVLVVGLFLFVHIFRLVHRNTLLLATELLGTLISGRK
jgi:hypothetical protein